MLIAAIALALAAPPAGAATRRSCSSPGARTVAQNTQARVFQRGSRLYGCLRSSGRRMKLDVSFDDGYVTSHEFRDVRLAGRYVAWVWESVDVSCKAACPPDYETTRTGVQVADLRHRRTRSTRAAPVAKSLRVSTRGGAAWAAEDLSGFAVHSYDAAGDRVLDTGNVGPASVRVTASIVSWAKDGASASRPLGPGWPD